MKLWFSLLFFFLIPVYFFAQDDYVDENRSNKKEKQVVKTRPVHFLPNPDYTSYFLSPTAYTLSSRDFRLASNDLIFYKCSYGVSNKTTLSASGSLFSSLVGSVKHKIKQSEEFDLSITASLGDLYAASSDTTILFTGTELIATLGDYENNFSFSTGFHYLYSNIGLIDDNEELSFHHVAIGYQRQLTRTILVSAEGMYFTNHNIFTGGAGFKFIIKRKYLLATGVMPIIWNNIRPSRYDQTSLILPFFSLRMLIERH